MSEVVEEGATGFLLQNTTVDEIERGILRSLETSEARKIEKNARQMIIERFGYPRVASDTLKAYNELLSIQG